MPRLFLSKLSLFLRRVYDWTISWAETSQALVALFAVSIAESFIFPIPVDVLLIAIVATNPTGWLRASAVCLTGSLIGAVVGYGIGSALMTTIGEPIINFYGAHNHWDNFVASAESWGLSFLAIAAFTPIPFKVATIASGAIKMPFAPFLLVSLLGRAGRFFLVAGILRVIGPKVRTTLENNFNLASLIFFTLLMAGFFILRYI